MIVPNSQLQLEVSVGPSDVQATFQVTNVSLSSVKLLGVTTSCSCISDSNNFPTVLHPGKSIDLSFRIQREIQAGSPPVSETIRLLTDRDNVVKNLVVQLAPEVPSGSQVGTLKK